MVLLLGSGCLKEYEVPILESEIVQDIDGNVYHTVKIGDQTWLVENLKVSRYNNGDPIPNITDQKEWSNTKIGAFCYYNNDSTNNDIYGKLYNYYTVSDSRKIAPKGFHVAHASDFSILLAGYGGCSNGAGTHLKEQGTNYWQFLHASTLGDNASGFKALPGGCRNHNNSKFDYMSFGLVGFWWSDELDTDSNPKGMMLSYNSSNATVLGYNRANGYSIRCVKD